MKKLGLALAVPLALVFAACQPDVSGPAPLDQATPATLRAMVPSGLMVPFEPGSDVINRSQPPSLDGLHLSPGTDCTFTIKKGIMRLDDDCTTDETIFVPDGGTLDGRGNTITAVDPPAGHFVGAVIANAGSVAHVTRITVMADGLINVCDGGADRLRGIMFEGASGSITKTTVVGINQGASGCQEGNGIEVRNAPFDGTHPNTMTVELGHNTVLDYQKTGIVANGDVDVWVHHSDIGASATQENLAANSIQLGFGATGVVEQNAIDGNQWMGTSNYVATAVLVYLANGVDLSKNNIRGNSEIGVYFYGDDGFVDNNKIFDEGPDHPNASYDIGLGDWGLNNTVTNNKVRGFETPYDIADLGTNKVVSGS